MKVLVIESPGKIEKLSKILGEGWSIVASYGHIREMPDREMGVAAPAYRPDYVVTERGRSAITKIAGLIRTGAEIYLATDPDREGESISWHLATVLGLDLKTTKRVTFNQLTPEAVLKAVNEPRTVDGRLVASQEARRVVDRLVGYSVSPELGRRAGHRSQGTWSAGRVQSPTVRLVVERERAIRNFKSTTHFGAKLSITGQGRAWSAKWRLKPGFVSDDEPYFMDKGFAGRVAQIRSLIVVSAADGEQRVPPPAPLITSTLQQVASAKLRVRPDEAMELAQALFDQGHITYHRTDNPNLSDEAMDPIRSIGAVLGLEVAARRRSYKVRDGAQAGHPAITPTHWDVEEAGETDKQRALYRLIRLRAIGSQLMDARYAKRAVVLKALTDLDGREIHFEADGRMLTDPGWMKVVGTAGDQEEGEDEEGEGELSNPVPKLLAGMPIAAASGEVTTSQTKAPGRYTHASLVRKLEAEGLGRPSTYASIMKTIEARDYVTTMGDKLRPTADGEHAVDLMVGRFGFMEIAFTRQVEEEFDKVAQGQMRYVDCVAAFHAKLTDELAGLARDVAVKPSEAMMRAVEQKAKRDKVPVPEGMKESREICERFLGPREDRDPTEGPRMASARQIELVTDLVGKGRIPAPAGFPDGMTAATASAALDKAFSSLKKREKT